jgi:methionyl-tRNA formyltransferase
VRIVLIGAVKFSEAVLSELGQLDAADVVGVCTLESSAANADHVDLTEYCNAHGIPVRYAPDINDERIVRWIRGLDPQVVCCVGWSRLIGDELLGVAPLGVIGYHPAALPANRGRHPLIWALALGLEETGSTFFFMDEGADSGDIISQRAIPIYDHDDAGSLYDRITEIALNQIREWVPLLAASACSQTPQDHSKSNSWRKRGASDGEIDWRMPADAIRNLVRALARPYVGAHFVQSGDIYSVWRVEVVREPAPNIEPGKVIRVTSEGVVVKAGIDAVLLVQTEPELYIAEGEYL